MTYSKIVNDSGNSALIQNYPTHKVCNGQILGYYDYPTELFEWACEQTGFDPWECYIEFPNGQRYTYQDALDETDEMFEEV